MPLGDATTTPLPHTFSVGIFLTLVIILTASALMFRTLVRRWTIHHRWAELQRWADENGLTLHDRDRATLPSPLDTLQSPSPTPVMSMEGKEMKVIEMRTLHDQRTDSSQFTRWHAVTMPIKTHWFPTGLRPRANPSSLLDLFKLTSYPSLLPPERFVVFGSESSTARRLARSKLPALLPPDVGLLLHGETLVLDFSSRPLDTIELTRLSVLLEQVAANLPTVNV